MAKTMIECSACDDTGWSKNAGQCQDCKRGRALAHLCAPCLGTGRLASNETCHVCKGTAQAKPPSDMPMRIALESVKAERADEALPRRIALGLFNAQIAVGRIAADARNDDFGFDYSSAEAVIERSGLVLRAEGLMALVVSVRPVDEARDLLADILPLLEGSVSEEVIGKVVELVAGGLGGTRLDVTLRVVHVESGEHWTSTRRVALNLDRNGRDWAESGAETLAISYWFRGVLMFPKGGVDVNARGSTSAPSEQRPETTAATARAAARGKTAAQPSSASPEMMTTSLLNDVSACKSVEQLESVAKVVERLAKKRQLRVGDVKALRDAIGEQRPRCEAHDAHADAEGDQTGRAA